VQTFLLFVSSFLKLITTFWRQSWRHKWELLGFLELLFCTLICVYENSITVNVVKPLVPKPFQSTKELYNNNFTFVVQIGNFGRVRSWLFNEYNRTNYHKIIKVDMFWNVSEWLERYFMNPHNGIKYAIVGHLQKNDHYRAVTFAKEKNDTCYQMFQFASAVASSLQEGISRLLATGLVQVYLNSQDFRNNLLATTFAKSLAAKYETELTYEDLQNKRLKENLITLGNLKSVLFAGLIITICAKVAFVAEICIFYHNNRKSARKITPVMSVSHSLPVK